MTKMIKPTKTFVKFDGSAYVAATGKRPRGEGQWNLKVAVAYKSGKVRELKPRFFEGRTLNDQVISARAYAADAFPNASSATISLVA